MNLQRARELRKNPTDCERLLWLRLRAHRLQGFKFKCQQPIGPYIIDFVCFEARCIVEADGGQHAEQAEYDARRDAWLKEQGFTVLRFWNNDILTNTDGVLSVIFAACRERLGTSSPQPLSRQGRGAWKPQPFNEFEGDINDAVPGEQASCEKMNISNSSSDANNSPLPARERGRGRGGDGL